MVSRIRIVFLAVCLTSGFAAVAGAEQSYFAFHAGYTVTEDADLPDPLGGVPHDLEPGLLAGGALGVKLDEGLRFELEMTYRMNSVETIEDMPAGGRVTAINAMFNLIQEFDLFVGEAGSYSQVGFSPYLGAGIGAARVAYEDLTLGGVEYGEQEDYVPAYQGIAGIAFGVGRSGVRLTVDYRFLTLVDSDSEGLSGPDFDAGYRHHSVLLGIRAPF